MHLPEVAELWRGGSVIGYQPLDLTVNALAANVTLDGFEGCMSNSGEGRWTIHAPIDEAAPAPLLSAAPYARFGSLGAADFANPLRSPVRHKFGDGPEKPAVDAGPKR